MRWPFFFFLSIENLRILSMLFNGLGVYLQYTFNILPCVKNCLFSSLLNNLKCRAEYRYQCPKVQWVSYRIALPDLKISLSKRPSRKFYPIGTMYMWRLIGRCVLYGIKGLWHTLFFVNLFISWIFWPLNTEKGIHICLNFIVRSCILSICMY